MEQQPTVGRIVHYVSRGSSDGVHPPACRAALINEVTDPAGDAGGGIVNLTVFIPNGSYNHFDVSHVNAEHAALGTWHWPERV